MTSSTDAKGPVDSVEPGCTASPGCSDVLVTRGPSYGDGEGNAPVRGGPWRSAGHRCRVSALRSQLSRSSRSPFMQWSTTGRTVVKGHYFGLRGVQASPTARWE